MLGTYVHKSTYYSSVALVFVVRTVSRRQSPCFALVGRFQAHPASPQYGTIHLDTQGDKDELRPIQTLER